MERKIYLETDGGASVLVRGRKKESEREREDVWLRVYIADGNFLCFSFFYRVVSSQTSWCPPSGMRIACISEYFHLRLLLLKSVDKCIYIIYTHSGRVKAGLTR